MLQRDGNPTPLGEAIQAYGRIFKSLHILAYLDDEAYRRDIKAIRNLQEGRHSLAGKVFHGKQGRALPALPHRHGGPARRARPRAQLHRAVEHRLHERRPGAAPRPRAPESATRTSRGSHRSSATTSASTATTRSCSQTSPARSETYATPPAPTTSPTTKTRTRTTSERRPRSRPARASDNQPLSRTSHQHRSGCAKGISDLSLRDSCTLSGTSTISRADQRR